MNAMRRTPANLTPLAAYVTGAAKTAGLSLDAVANTLGIAPSQLSRYLSGRIRMPLARAAHLAHLLRLTEVQSDSLLVLIEISSSSPKLRVFVAELEQRAARGERRDRKLEKAEEYLRYLRTSSEESGQVQAPLPDAYAGSVDPTPLPAD
jgi:transcriptional regulator with XRE-family HTH domain